MARKQKNKRDRLEMTGIIETAHKGCMFDVVFEGNDNRVLASISGKMRKSFIKVIPGDKVKVELSPYDMTKGRIVQRLR